MEGARVYLDFLKVFARMKRKRRPRRRKRETCQRRTTEVALARLTGVFDSKPTRPHPSRVRCWQVSLFLPPMSPLPPVGPTTDKERDWSKSRVYSTYRASDWSTSTPSLSNHCYATVVCLISTYTEFAWFVCENKLGLNIPKSYAFHERRFLQITLLMYWM